ncbi:MAG: hypothetical protein A2Z30_03265 [Chloroflexi bacterium RBG_16_64_43]|nr:MAG: hypothetical protein A2Z30_03265 [Chloroflexi bacterium RBG_16_64_43]
MPCPYNVQEGMKVIGHNDVFAGLRKREVLAVCRPTTRDNLTCPCEEKRIILDQAQWKDAGIDA